MSTNNTTEDGEPWVYHGFPESNTTPIPDEFFDLIAPKLTEAELRVSLYVMRRTRGFKKSEDAISFSQLVGGIKTRDGRILDQGTGMSKSAVWRGVNGLVAKGILLKHTALSPLGDNETNVYRIHYRGEGGVVLQKNHPGSPKEPPVVLQENTQETVLQEAVEDTSNSADLAQPDSPTDRDSKFRKDSRQKGQEGRPNQRGISHPIPDHQERSTSTLHPATSSAPNVDGMNQIGEVLKTKGIPVHQASATSESAQRPPSLPKPPRQGTPTRIDDEAREVIQRYLGDFAPELGDQAPFQSTVSRVCNVYAASGLTIGAFVARLYAARSRTKEAISVSRIRNRSKRFAYFCALLEEECGLREPPSEIAAAAKAKAEQAALAAPSRQRKSLLGKYAPAVQRHLDD